MRNLHKTACERLNSKKDATIKMIFERMLKNQPNWLIRLVKMKKIFRLLSLQQ